MSGTDVIEEDSRRFAPCAIFYEQESVWDYPRPPRVERSDEEVEIWFAGVRIAKSQRTVRVLETSHPPTYYIPKADVETVYLSPSPRRTMCEFKGQSHFYTVSVDGRSARNAVWEYPEPQSGYEALKDHLCFYPSLMERCLVNGEAVTPQEGDFYGGWITRRIVGPYKGGAGTWGW